MNGRRIDSFSIDEWRKRIGIVTQEPVDKTIMFSNV